MYLGLLGIGEAEVLGSRLGGVGLAEDISQLEHGVGAAELSLCYLRAVLIFVLGLADVLEYLVADGDGRVVGVPELLGRLLLADLGDVRPAVGLLLEGAIGTPVRVVLLVRVVRVHLQQVGGVPLGVGRDEELGRVARAMQLHAVVGVLVEVLAAAGQPEP